MKSNKSFMWAFSAFCFFTLTAGSCGGGDEVEIPPGVEKINFVIQVYEGGVRYPGNNVLAHFHADAHSQSTGTFINVDAEVTLTHGRATLLKDLPDNLEGSADDIARTFFTSIELGENGYAEGYIDASRVSISDDGKVATLYVNFDLADPYSEYATTSVLRMLRTPSTGEGRSMLALRHSAEGDRNPFVENIRSGARRSDSASVAL